MYASTDPAVIAGADRIIASLSEAARLAPHNELLFEDKFINNWVGSALGGQPTVAAHLFADVFSDGYPESDVGVLAGEVWADDVRWFAHEVPDDGGPVTRQVVAVCHRCWRPGQIAQANYKTFWLACGRLIVELIFCSDCSSHYIDKFGAVAKEIPDGAM
jgi:hypothetical protein